ncbi:uncharacterized protein BX663DRAFT_551984 [Cokeromyces recurvatus]|uniref:uncharacterized protein n=1 Tax=Cokeromyces recurvatus TaxID=90255 RepID=UPI0022203831|nr:uncharacterized protein BX663DRAFT_551984 [Cokeromyces recurvatus]KAI7902571.1 hypothetical protein BX663DRAFT_551984 [Cokeromyces recurvatus]
MLLYNKLCAALNENEIDELGLLPLIPEINEIPIKNQKYYPLIVVESKLGIAISSSKILLKQSHEYFISLDDSNDKEIEQVTRIMILLKPDNYTAMNRRKRLIISGYIDIKRELRLIELIFTIPRHAKSSFAWSHRQWILTNYYKTIDITHELKLCQTTSILYPRNYYAWTFRYWILSTFCDQTRIEQEYQEMLKWIELNISDFSGLQYLQQIMTLAPTELNSIQQHMEWLDQLIIKYPGHESLWCHRRFCTAILTEKSVEHCKAQHRFVYSILHDQFNSQSLSNNPNDLVMQKEFALRFGLWQTLLEKKHYSRPIIEDALIIKLYSTVAPVPEFIIDRQETL